MNLRNTDRDVYYTIDKKHTIRHIFIYIIIPIIVFPSLIFQFCILYNFYQSKIQQMSKETYIIENQLRNISRENQNVKLKIESMTSKKIIDKLIKQKKLNLKLYPNNPSIIIYTKNTNVT